MRWEELFADLEARIEAADQAELAAEVADRTRREVARLRLVDRLRASVGQEVVIAVLGVGPLSGRVADAGPDWLLLAEGLGRESLVPLSSFLGLTGIGMRSTEPGSEGKVAQRLNLSHALRGIARDRSPVTVVLVDGSSLSGTIDRVGADFVEVAEHAPGEARRRGEVRAVRTLPHSAIGAVRTAI